MTVTLERVLAQLKTFERDSVVSDLENVLYKLRDAATTLLDAALHLSTCRKMREECEHEDHLDHEDAEWYRDGSGSYTAFPSPGVPAMLDSVENLVERLTREGETR